MSFVVQKLGQDVYVNETAVVNCHSKVGDRTKIWHFSHVMADAVIGEDCILGQGVFVDNGAVIGNCCKIQNGVSIYAGVTLEDGVFVGPHATFTNDLRPRAINPDGSLKGPSDWTCAKTLVKYGASIGANSTIICGVTIGRFAMVAAGAVVTRDVLDYELVCGVPAHHMRFIDEEGKAR